MTTPHELVLEAKSQIREASRDEVQQALGRSVIIDVREPEEIALGHLPDALCVPRGVIEFKIGSLPETQNLETPIVLYCRSGGRSALAALQLKKLGYVNVVSMAGGFDAWIADGRPVIKPAPVSYD